MISNKETIMDLLETKPLKTAIKELLATQHSDLSIQIFALEQQAEGLTGVTRQLILEAIEKLKEAESKNLLPLHIAIAKAITTTAQQAGLRAKKKTTSSSKKRARYSKEEIRQKITNVLPSDPITGMAGSTIARESGISYQTLIKHLTRFEEEGILVRQGTGKNTTWHRRNN